MHLNFSLGGEAFKCGTVSIFCWIEISSICISKLARLEILNIRRFRDYHGDSYHFPSHSAGLETSTAEYVETPASHLHQVRNVSS